MNIFESLENLEVSEECFEDIMSKIEEGLTKALTPVLAGKDKYGREESFGTKIDRAYHKHPLIMKVANKIDGVMNKPLKTNVDSRTPEQKLKNIKPAGTIYGKDMYLPQQLKDAGYKLKE